MIDTHSPPSVSPEAQQLADAMRKAAEGDWSATLPHAASPDLSLLCRAFSTLAASLQQIEIRRKEEEETRRLAALSLLHDLRAPLTTILGYTEALEAHPTATPEKRSAYLAAIKLRAGDLASLIDEFSAAERGIPREASPPAASAALIGDFFRAEQERLHREQVSVHLCVDETLTLPVSRLDLQRILTNLLTNTVKYRGHPSSAVTITCRKEETAIVLSYHDDGPGVPPDALPHLFQAGYRAPDAARRPGSGLGLHIIAEIAGRSCGAVSAANDHGLTITLTFPMTGGLSC